MNVPVVFKDAVSSLKMRKSRWNASVPVCCHSKCVESLYAKAEKNSFLMQIFKFPIFLSCLEIHSEWTHTRCTVTSHYCTVTLKIRLTRKGTSVARVIPLRLGSYGQSVSQSYIDHRSLCSVHSVQMKGRVERRGCLQWDNHRGVVCRWEPPCLSHKHRGHPLQNCLEFFF